MSLALAPGLVVASRYRLKERLGEGGMGEVWAATHTLTRKPVALKFLKLAAACKPDAVKRFMREARAASAVRHPNVVEIHDIVELDSGLPVMVMDRLIGESLAQYRSRKGTIEVGELASLLVPVLSALGTAHALGIVHRDLKPENIFLERMPNGTLLPKVLDFGIAKLTASEGDAALTEGLTDTGSFLGTPFYVAPEQAFGEKELDHRADIWALGVILYECLSGKRPIDGENLGKILRTLVTGDIVPLDDVAPNLPADIRALVGSMMLLDRTKRASDLSEILAVLGRYTDVEVPGFEKPRASLTDSALDARAGGSLREPIDAAAVEVQSAPHDNVTTAGPTARTNAPTKHHAPRFALVAASAMVALGIATVTLTNRTRFWSKPEAASSIDQNAITPLTESAHASEAAPVQPPPTSVPVPSAVPPIASSAATPSRAKSSKVPPPSGAPAEPAPLTPPPAASATALPHHVQKEAPF